MGEQWERRREPHAVVAPLQQQHHAMAALPGVRRHDLLRVRSRDNVAGTLDAARVDHAHLRAHVGQTEDGGRVERDNQ